MIQICQFYVSNFLLSFILCCLMNEMLITNIDKRYLIATIMISNL